MRRRSRLAASRCHPLQPAAVAGRGLLFFLVLMVATITFAADPIAREVRVLLATAQAVEVVAPGAHAGAVDGARTFSAATALAWPVTAHGGRLFVDDLPVGTTLSLTPLEGYLSAFGKHYRGRVDLTADGDDVMVINVLDLEDYLKGVVPTEMIASWPTEALRAQAVAARSYAIASIGGGGQYDLCATDECQVYGGLDAEDDRTNNAVTTTAGVVVTYGGEVAKTYYHSDSGGAVASSLEVWGVAVPYLPARTDVAASTPYRSWVERLSPATVGASLDAEGLSVGQVRGLRVVSVTESGRVLELDVTGSAGSVRLRGLQLTRLARGWGLRSTRFQTDGGLTVTGDGWGHGVGMSQYGARAMALAGYEFGQILSFYYPSTDLTRFVAAR